MHIPVTGVFLVWLKGLQGNHSHSATAPGLAGGRVGWGESTKAVQKWLPENTLTHTFQIELSLPPLGSPSCRPQAQGGLLGVPTVSSA